jgi:hypothetical protein
VDGSRFDAATAYVTKSRRRQDDFRPQVFRTTDSGAHWTRIVNGLPEVAEATSIVEDTVNPNLLFLGTSAGVFVSFDRGENWVPFRSNMAPAPVTDLLIHPREGDLVVGTYGRGVWVTNIVPLRGIGKDLISSDAVLLPVRPFAERNEGAQGNYRLLGDRYPFTPNELNGMTIAYYLKNGDEEAPVGRLFTPCVADEGGSGATRPYVTVADSSGKVVCTMVTAHHAGINQVVWGLNHYAPQTGGGGGRGRGGFQQGPRAEPGEYTFTLHAGGKTYVQKARLISRVR